MEYPKINSLWKRPRAYLDAANKTDFVGKNILIPGDYACPEFSNIRKWAVEEKVDGTNIRIFFNRWDNDLSLPMPQIGFGGRTENAQIPRHLLNYLQTHFTHERLNEAFSDASSVILFGEGYGPKIQACGGNYSAEAGFTLFDIRIGNWWLQRGHVRDLASKLGIPMVPDLGIMEEEQIVEFIKSKPLSQCSRIPQMMEGVVCRSDPLMLTRSGHPVMFKLKCRDFA